MEMRELLDQYEYDGDNTPIIRGSALGALNGVDKWVDSVMQLMDAVDTWIPLPPREVDKPFLMPVEDVFSITGRGTVATGRIETGKVKVGDEVELLGLGEDKKCVVTGVEMFRKLLDEGEAGDNVGLLPTLSSLSVSYKPESRFRHRCSSIYLRISPLHMEFHSPLLHSS